MWRLWRTTLKECEWKCLKFYLLCKKLKIFTIVMTTWPSKATRLKMCSCVHTVVNNASILPLSARRTHSTRPPLRLWVNVFVAKQRPNCSSLTCSFICAARLRAQQRQKRKWHGVILRITNNAKIITGLAAKNGHPAMAAPVLPIGHPANIPD